jgi:peptidoglycan/xylan/chitin deacetylase (PgdA/CDA1 family)
VFEFANHTKSLHTRGSDHTLVQTIDKQSFVEDIKECEIFATAKGVFAYPFGGYNEEVINRLKELDFKLGFTSKPGLNNLSINPFELHRNGVLINIDFDRFIEMLEK